MKSLKRILANLTMVCMLASMFPMTFVQAAETDYNFSSEVTEFTKYGASGVENKKGSFTVTKGQFEESGNLLVFTYDAYVPDFKDTKQTLYLQFKDNNNKVFALGSKIGFLNGNRKMYAFNKETTENVGSLGITNALSFNNMTTDASGGQWVNLKTVIKYDSTKKAYVSWNYFNGKAIVTSENEVAKITYIPTAEDLSSIQGRTSIGYTIGARCGADEENTAGNIKVANIGLSVYSTTEFEKTIEVASGANEVTVPVTNAKFKDDTTVPAEVKGGLIDVSNATVTATKNGTAVSGVTAANTAVAHSGSVNNVADGSAFKLSGLPALVQGDVLKVTINGAISADDTSKSIELELNGNGSGSGGDPDPGVDPEPGEKNDKYYYEDFSGCTDENILTSSGYTGITNSNRYAYTYGTNDIALGCKYYADSNADTVTGPSGFNITKEEFEDSGNLLVFSYDAYIPDSNDAKQSIYTYFQFEGEGSGNKQFALGPKLYFTSSAGRSLCGFNCETDNNQKIIDGTQYLTGLGFNSLSQLSNVNADASGGQWVNIKTVVKYDKTDKTYTSWNYVNGKPILNSGKMAELKVTPTAKWLSAMQNRTGIKFVMGTRCGAEGESGKDIAVDNICFNLYGDSVFERFIEADSGDVTIPVWNSNFKNDTDVSRKISAGMLDVSASEITAKLYDADDLFRLSGVEQKSVYIINSPSVQDGSEITVKDVPELKKNQMLVIDIDSIEGLEGESKNVHLIICGKGSDKVDFYRVNMFDFLNNPIIPQKDNDTYVISDKTTSFNFYTADYTNKGIKIVNESNDEVKAVTSFNSADGKYTVSLKELLQPGGKYKMLHNNQEAGSFRTEVSSGSVEFTIENNGMPTFKYINTSDKSENATFITAGYDTDGKFLKAVMDKQELNGRTIGSFKTSQSLGSGISSYNGFAWLGKEFEDAKEDSKSVYVKPFDESTSLSETVASFGTDNAKNETADLVVLNAKNEVVYADKMNTDQNGKASKKIDFSKMVSGQYKFYVKCKEEVYKTEKYYLTPSETETELAAFVKMSQQEMEDYINTNGAKLDLDYNYYQSLAYKKQVVSELYAFVQNNLNITKAELVSMFRQLSVIQAFKEGKIADITDVSEDISCLNKEPASQWFFADNSVIASDRRERWNKFITKQLNGASINGVPDFEQKIMASLLFAGINDRQSTDSLKLMMEDFADKLGLNKSHITTSVILKLGTSYSGFDLDTLKSDMQNAASYNNYPIPDGGSTSGSSGGGSSLSFSNKPVTSPQPIGPDGEQNAFFKDLDNYEWAEKEITELAQKGIIAGRGDEKFEPGELITREEFLKLIVSIAGVTSSNSDDIGFNDVSKDDWYYKYIKAAVENNYVKGVSDELFGVGENITREDMVTLLYRMLSQQGIVLRNEKNDFTDFEDISEYAQKATAFCAGEGIINGYEDGTFRPHNNANRAEAAKLVYAALMLLK